MEEIVLPRLPFWWKAGLEAQALARRVPTVLVGEGAQITSLKLLVNELQAERDSFAAILSQTCCKNTGT